MSYANPIWLEGRRKYWMRSDAYRFARPGSPEAKMPGWLDPWATRVRAKEAAEDEERACAAAEQDELEREILHLRWMVKDLKLELELRRFRQKYSPDQPRSPKGNPDGGQWIRDTGRDGSLVSEPAAMRRGPPDQRPPVLLHVPVGKPAGPEAPRQRITIINNAQTGMSNVDETTEKLRKTLEDVVNRLPEGSGPGYGTRVHTEFANAVRDQNLYGIGRDGVEQTFPRDQPRGSADSIRTDITLWNDSGEPIAIYDVKTGGATLTAGRVSELLRKSNASPTIPVIEMHVLRGLSLKARVRDPIESWIILMRVWRPGLPGIADLVEGQSPF